MIRNVFQCVECFDGPDQMLGRRWVLLDQFENFVPCVRVGRVDLLVAVDDLLREFARIF